MLSGSYKLATKNINADDIATVSVYENHQPVRALKDFSFSNKAALNLTLKNSRRLKPIGYFQQGVGYDEQTLCKSNLFAMQVGKKFQHLLSLKYNDIGDTYNTQGVYDADLVADFSSFTWNGIGLSAQDMPDISLNRYLNNKSGEASLNSLFKLKISRRLLSIFVMQVMIYIIRTKRILLYLLVIISIWIFLKRFRRQYILTVWWVR